MTSLRHFEFLKLRKYTKSQSFLRRHKFIAKNAFLDAQNGLLGGH